MRRQLVALTLSSRFRWRWRARARGRHGASRGAGRRRHAHPASSWTRSIADDRSLHRLLPVRLRRLDREEPGSGRSPLARPLHRGAGAQLHDPAPHPRRRRRHRTGDRKKAADYYAACMDEATIEASRPRADRAATWRPSTSSSTPTICRFSSRTCTRSACRSLFRFARRPTCATRRSRLRDVDQGGLAPARSRLLPQDRRALGRAARQVRRARRRSCSRSPAQPAEQRRRATPPAVLAIENRARQRLARSRDAARSGHDPASDDAQRAAAR